MRHHLAAMMALAVVASLTGPVTYQEQSPFDSKTPPPPQDPTRRQQKLDAAQAKRDRKNAMRAARKAAQGAK